MPINLGATSLDVDAIAPLAFRACLHFAGRKRLRVKNSTVDESNSRLRVERDAELCVKSMASRFRLQHKSYGSP
jgi:hypothetical protein